MIGREDSLASYCGYVESKFSQSQPQQSEVTVPLECFAFTRYVGTGDTCEVFTFGCDSDPGGADDGDGCGDMLGTSGPNGGLNFYTDIEFTVRVCRVIISPNLCDISLFLTYYVKL